MGINNVFSPKRGEQACFDVLTIKDRIETHSAACGEVVRAGRDTVVVRNFIESSRTLTNRKSLVVKRVSLYSPSAAELLNNPSDRYRGNPNVDRVFVSSDLKGWKKDRENEISKSAEEAWQRKERTIREDFESRPRWGCPSRPGESPSGASLQDTLASEKRKLDERVKERIKTNEPEAITEHFFEYVREINPGAEQDLRTRFRELGVFIVNSSEVNLKDSDDFRSGNIQILDPHTKSTYFKISRADLVSVVHRMLNEISAFPGINLQDK